MSKKKIYMKPKRTFCFGEVLWDIFPDEQHEGGAPMNVALNLLKMGQAATLISRVGQDELGDRLLAFLEEQGADNNYVLRDAQRPTGTVQVSLSEQGNASYEIVQPVAWDFIQAPEALLQEIREEDYLVFGSLATRAETSYLSLQRLLETPATKVLDINLRKPFYSRERIAALMHAADILKINEDEAELLSTWFFPEIQAHSDISEALRQRFTLKGILITLGAEGAYAHFEDAQYRHSGYAVQVADTVGSGDAWLGGFLSQWMQGKDLEHCVSVACATGALVATFKGAHQPYTAAQVDAFIQSQA